MHAIRDKQTIIKLLLDTKPELSIPEFEKYIHERNMFPGDIDDDDEDEEDNTPDTFAQEFPEHVTHDNVTTCYDSSDCYSGDSVPLISFKPKENKDKKKQAHDSHEESYNDDHHSSMVVIDPNHKKKEEQKTKTPVYDSSDSYNDDHHSSMAIIDLEHMYNKKKNKQQKRTSNEDSFKQHVLYDSSDSNDSSEIYKKHKR